MIVLNAALSSEKIDIHPDRPKRQQHGEGLRKDEGNRDVRFDLQPNPI